MILQCSRCSKIYMVRWMLFGAVDSSPLGQMLLPVTFPRKLGQKLPVELYFISYMIPACKAVLEPTLVSQSRDSESIMKRYRCPTAHLWTTKGQNQSGNDVPDDLL
jgi:hypothetical protein